MLNKQQIKLVQTAVRAAGLRTTTFEGRYRFLLSHYTQSNGSPVTSCKQLNNWQLDDLLAICEAHGWRMPGKPADYYRQLVARRGDYASFAQQQAIKHLAGDLGWNELQLGGMIERMTGGSVKSPSRLKPGNAYKIIEALKAMLSRETGKQYSSLKEVQKDMEATDGKEKQAS